MSDRVKSVDAHLRSSVTQDLEDLRKAHSLYDTAKQDLLRKKDDFRKSVRLYENFLGVYNFGPSDLSLPLPKKSVSVQTDSLPRTVTNTNSETQTDCIRNTQESSVATETMCGVRDVGVSVIPVVECATHQPYTQSMKAYEEVAGENSTYRGATSTSLYSESVITSVEATMPHDRAIGIETNDQELFATAGKEIAPSCLIFPTHDAPSMQTSSASCSSNNNLQKPPSDS
ncbi:hypothetical protein QAD02_013579 [Eretmocerus hayati]|uniref:Uncharacterized protein n=1 Tax=Eretmocerus hayati TaxID=131215 RepID=A0ACC2P333_9HYME|nr:hypothetical protein QAD02_013579 [Eretmocerus hayati]